jgi:parallel beta-helix repeat protein
MFRRTAIGALGAGLLALGASAPAHAATFAVNNNAGAGAGSLRAAITAANGTAAPDTIEFAIPGNGVHTITPAVQLPAITQPVSIEGYSQPGSSAATAAGIPAVPTIVINGVNVVRGLDIQGNGVEVRGLVIRDTLGDGIVVQGSDSVIAGNYLGLNAAGVVANPNAFHGVHVSAGTNNRVGGPAVEDRNVIASNPAGEVFVFAGANTQRIEGNYLGTDETGDVAIGGGGGVELESAFNTVEDNLIASELAGVHIEGNNNTVRGNKVGTGVDGDTALGNFEGINVFGGDQNVIDDNLASGNLFSGVQLVADGGNPAVGNTVQDNQIGTNAAGSAALPNGTGVTINASNGNTFTGNVIAGNSSDGVLILDVDTANAPDADDNRLEENKIGMPGLGNGGSGVRIDGGDQNHVGDPGNTITDNGVDGVTVVAGVGNAIRKNSILDNGALGIDLGANGPTPNDPLDADIGPNQLQNDPEITAASGVQFDWQLESAPLTSYRLDFFVSGACDPAGSGEGETFLDSIQVNTNANGFVNGQTVTAIAAGVGKQVTMTATKLQGAASRSTSEFSPCRLTV